MPRAPAAVAVRRTFSPFATVRAGVGVSLLKQGKGADEMPKTVREVMTSNPCSIDADKSVAYAAKMMRDEDVGIAPIVEGDRLVGVLTDRDIAVRVVAEGRDPEQVKAAEVASRDVVPLDPEPGLDEA